LNISKNIKMVQNIIIGKAEYSDLKDILSLQKTAFLSEAELYDNYDIEPLTQTINSIENDFKTHIFLKAEYQNKIIGSVKIKDNGEFCWIGKLMVIPGYRNKGIGRKLMLAAEKIYPKGKQFILFTGYKSINNIKLYESIGYTKSEEFSDEKNPDIILVKMIKNPV